jgi:putative membrane protein
MPILSFLTTRFFARLWLYERFGWFAIILHLLFWIALITLIITLIRRNRLRRTAQYIHHRQNNENNPIEIAKARYANGEITKAEFDQIKNDMK